MKIRWKKVFYFVIFLGSLVGFKNVVGQNEHTSIQKEKNNINQQYSISGIVLENDSITPIPFCNIVLSDSHGNIIEGATSDFNGFFNMYPVPNGIYTLSLSFVGYKKHVIENFEVNQNIDFEIMLEQSNIDIEFYEIHLCYQTPLIDRSKTRSVETFDSNDIQRMPGR
jgi:hypothetical protein